MYRKLIAVLLSTITLQVMAQEELPFKQIPDYPDEHTQGNIMARLIQGLGYRYYWATEGLREEDLSYRPTEEAQSARETLEHILGLSEAVVNAPTHKPNKRPGPDRSALSFPELRRATLENFKAAADLYRGMGEAEIATLQVVFQREDKKSEFPHWNLINGQISDALYHVGQIVSFRRTSGNPLPRGVNVFIGKTRE